MSNEDLKPKKYSIVRFYAPHLPNRPRVIRKGCSLAEAQEHCKNPKTRKEGVYFDGYREE